MVAKLMVASQRANRRPVVVVDGDAPEIGEAVGGEKGGGGGERDVEDRGEEVGAGNYLGVIAPSRQTLQRRVEGSRRFIRKTAGLHGAPSPASVRPLALSNRCSRSATRPSPIATPSWCRASLSTRTKTSRPSTLRPRKRSEPTGSTESTTPASVSPGPAASAAQTSSGRSPSTTARSSWSPSPAANFAGSAISSSPQRHSGPSPPRAIVPSRKLIAAFPST